MLLPRFMRFYGHSTSDALAEYARAFFGLCNSMLEIQADEMLDLAVASNPTPEGIQLLREQSRGIDKILQEVRIAKNARQ